MGRAKCSPPQAPPGGHLRTWGAPDEDRAPGSGEGLGKESMPRRQCNQLPHFFTLFHREPESCFHCISRSKG